MEQPNATHDGDAALTPIFWVALVLTSVATGLFAIFLMWLLAVFEHAAFHFNGGSYQNAVAAVSGLRRVVSLTIAGVVGAVGWYLIRRLLRHDHAEIDDALWRGDGKLSFRRSILTSALSEVVIGRYSHPVKVAISVAARAGRTTGSERLP